MNGKTCSIVVTTTDGEEIKLRCTPDDLRDAKTAIGELRLSMQLNNTVRLWKLGDSDRQILPSQKAVDKLIGILQNNVGEGAMDLVWDYMIDLQIEHSIPKLVFLGKNLVVNVNDVKSIVLHEEI